MTLPPTAPGIDRIPTVKGLPWLGNALQYRRAPLELLVDGYWRLGPVFRLRFPGRSVVVVAGETARAVLQEEERLALHRRGLFDPFSNEVGVDIFGACGDAHRRLRSTLLMPYSRQIASQFTPELFETVADAATQWRPGETQDLFKLSERLAVFGMMAMLTPIRIHGVAESLCKAADSVMHAVSNLRPACALKAPWYLGNRGRTYKTVDEVVERHRDGEFADLPKMYLADAFLESIGSGRDRATVRAVRGASIYALAGAQIYAGRILGFLLYELLRNRALLGRVLDEVDAAFRDGHIEAAAYYRMPHLRAAYFETLRYYPLLPGSPFHASRGMTIAGHAIPAGSYILFAPHLEHFSQDHYENPLVFDAARCLSPRKEIAKKGAFAPFGTGGRSCIGQGLSEILILSAASAILRSWDLRLENPSVKMALVMAPLLSPRDTVAVSPLMARSPGRARPSALSEVPDFDPSLESDAAVRALLAREPALFPRGSEVIREGDAADAFYVLLNGKAAVWKSEESRTERVRVAEFAPGESFGETGLLKNVPRTATVRAETDIAALRIGREDFLDLISRLDVSAGALGAYLYRQSLKRALELIFPGLDHNLHGDDFYWKKFEPEQALIRQGEPSDTLYVLVKGKVRVVSENDGGTETLASLGPGEFFGEIGILNSRPRTASVVAETAASCLCMKRERLLEIVNSDPGAIDNIARTLCGRLVANLNRWKK